MKSIIKKLGIALALAASCILAAPVAPVGAVPEPDPDDDTNWVRGYEVENDVRCTPNPCPFDRPGRKICCQIMVIPA